MRGILVLIANLLYLAIVLCMFMLMGSNRPTFQNFIGYYDNLYSYCLVVIIVCTIVLTLINRLTSVNVWRDTFFGRWLK